MIFEVLWPFLSLSSAIYFPKVTWRVELYLSFKKYPWSFSLTSYSFLFSNLILCIDIFPWCLHFFCYYSVALDCIVYISLCFCANISVESTPSSYQSLYIVKILIMTPNCPPKSLSEFALPQAVFCIRLWNACFLKIVAWKCLGLLRFSFFLPFLFLSFCFPFFFLSFLSFSLPPFPSIQSSVCTRRLFHSGQCCDSPKWPSISLRRWKQIPCLPAQAPEEILQALNCVWEQWA